MTDSNLCFAVRIFGSSVTLNLSNRSTISITLDTKVSRNICFLSPDNLGAVKLPSYGLADAGATLYLGKFSARVNINNVFDTVYIAESETNIHATAGSETWNGIDVANSVWFGFGRTWNASLKYRF